MDVVTVVLAGVVGGLLFEAITITFLVLVDRR